MVAPLVWLICSIKIVGPDEMAVKVIFGKPVEFCDSGWVFDLRLPPGKRFKCFLQRYPKKMYDFDYRAREVITRTGKYENTYYGSQVLKADSVAYLNFPREKRNKATGDDIEDIETDTEGIEKTHPLVKILRSQIPIDDEGLKNWTEEAVLGALRVAFGKITWRQAVDDIKTVTNEAENVFKSADGALIRAGFSKKGIQLVIAEITLPPKLQQAMPDVDRQRLEAEAAPYEAEQESIETGGAVIRTFCNLTGMTQDKVEKALQENADEFVKKYKDPWEKSWDIIHRRMGIDGGAYIDIRTANSLQDLLALIKKMPMGKPSGRQEEKEENSGLPKKKEHITMEERKELFKD